MNKYIKVDGHAGLVRDRYSGAIINVNSSQMSQARERRKVWKDQQQELADLKNDVKEMKAMMLKLVGNKDGSNSS